MTKPSIDATGIIKFAIAVAVAAIGAALYVPSVAQDKVDTRAEQVEKIDVPHEAAQDRKIDEIDKRVNALVTSQAVANSESKAMRETIKALIAEMQKRRVR